ncbi:MAG: sugar ABC transporter ATP-binding protein [Clostridiales bacterium]|nr:sugar ABC transporter ATP-binding protein [Clostridiales bacterium]
MAENFFLEMEHISKTFPGAKVLDDIELRIRPGEVRALMGENGAGKSTLIKILGGIYQMDAGGQIKIEGRPVGIRSVGDARAQGISIIHQEISLADNMTVFDNLFMGREIMGSSKLFLDDRKMVSDAQATIDKMDIDVDVRTLVKNLSIAKQQMVEISRALMFNARLIVMDEPTSSLTEIEIEQLFQQIDRLRRAGIAVIYISHRMEEIFRVADSVTVLRDGRLIGTRPVRELSRDELIAMMVGRKLSEIYGKSGENRIGDVCLEVRGFRNARLNDVSFSLRRGEVLGFAGLVGAGRSELARAIFGIDRREHGELLLNGRPVKIAHPADAIRHGIGFVPENRKLEGLFLTNTLRYNMTLPILHRFMGFVGVNRKKEMSIVDKYVHELSIRMTGVDQLVNYLSGGNQQKVVVSKWLLTEPTILILDEPTRGIDVGAKSEIYHLISELADKGVAVMMISSEMEEIINLSDRIIVLHEGTVTGEIPNDPARRATQEEILLLASGGNANEDNA